MGPELTIIVLAAGRGTRFGGPKQSTPLGPDGELLLDYTLRDAAVAGFTRAVVVVGDDVRDGLRAHLDRRAQLPVELVVQSAPLGTAHAVLVGTSGVSSPFAAANADDWYGPEAFAALASFLRADEPDEPDVPVPRAAVIGYAAGATLSPVGGVSRAVCRVDARGRLLAIEEVTGVRRDGDRIVSDSGDLNDATPVSMNLWGFTPAAFARLRPRVDAFLADAGTRELRLPDLVGEFVARGELDVSVLPTTAAWFGVTHPEDADGVRARLRALADADAAVCEMAAHFATRSAPVAATALVHGHIHETFVVACGTDRRERVVLQRLNGTVFRDLAALAENWRRITEHLARIAARRGDRALVAEPVPTRAGGLLHIDGSGAGWRMTRYVEASRVLGLDATPKERRAAARAFAELTRDLDGVGTLAETIPRFHDLPRRRTDLTAAVAADPAGRAEACRELVTTANRLGDAIERSLALVGAARLPVRIVHNDAKLDNVLVDSTTGAVACIVDLDTVMPGSVLNDFGELVRTAATTAAEDEPELDRVRFDPERFATIAAGYLEGGSDFLTGPERDALAYAGPLLAVENGVRFLTDHLDGDLYFRVHRPGHNLHRARVQFALAEQMLEQIDDLGAIIIRESERVA